jgi:TRAP-type mannitol/chloroaromatic compound transport system permease small subunit
MYLPHENWGARGPGSGVRLLKGRTAPRIQSQRRKREMKGILSFIRCVDSINRVVGRGIAWLSLFMVVVVTGDVVLRYAFQTSYVFTQELEWHLFAVFFLLVAGYTLLHDAHVRVDLFYQKLTPKTQAWINLLGVIFFLLPGCYLIMATASKFAWLSWGVREMSPDPGGIPARYLLKAMVPLGFSLIALQGVSMGLKSLLFLLGRPVQGAGEKP